MRRASPPAAASAVEATNVPPPSSRARADMSAGTSETTCTVPPSASLPYCTDPVPRTISIRSTPASDSHARY